MEGEKKKTFGQDRRPFFCGSMTYTLGYRVGGMN